MRPTPGTAHFTSFKDLFRSIRYLAHAVRTDRDGQSAPTTPKHTTALYTAPQRYTAPQNSYGTAPPRRRHRTRATPALSTMKSTRRPWHSSRRATRCPQQFLALLDRCAAAERDAAAQDAIAALASSVAEIADGARRSSHPDSIKTRRHERTADAIAAAAAVCVAMTGDETNLDANDVDAAFDAARRRLAAAAPSTRTAASRCGTPTGSATPHAKAAARACHRTDAKRARAVAAAVTALQRAERAHPRGAAERRRRRGRPHRDGACEAARLRRDEASRGRAAPRRRAHAC